MSAVERLDQWVTRAAQKEPESLAVQGSGEALSYGELDRLTNRVARLLRAAGCGPGDVVPFLMAKSPVAVAALVAIYKAGAIAIPLDVGNPAPRLARILRRAESRFLLAGAGAESRVAELAAAERLRDVTVIWLSGGASRPEAGRRVLGVDAVEAQDGSALASTASVKAAHILFTSGSTGEPKGVVVRHESVIRFVEWAVRHFRMERGERLSCHSPLHFDLSTFDIFGAFATGAELHLVPPEAHLLPARLAAFIRERGLTQWFSVPSALCYMTHLGVVKQDDFPTLRRLLWCGETFPTPALHELMGKLPHVAFTNLYGPTEAAIASSYHDVPTRPVDLKAPVPIGRACDGEELHVLDDALRPLGPGAVGELAISGVGLSPGYYRDPERTAAAFVHSPDPALRGVLYRTGDLAWKDEEGIVHLIGRLDSQIKCRGYRIELGEIESAIAQTGLASEAVVTSVPTGGFEGQCICCAFVPAASVDPARMRQELARLLPSYMIPTRWSVEASIPRNGNGKLDRRRVRESFEKVLGEQQPEVAERGAASCR